MRIRVLDSTQRLLTAISAPQAIEVDRLKEQLLRVRYDEQRRGKQRRQGAIKGSGHLKAWRQVVEPHYDVSSGRFQQAEFAADLWQVYLKEGSAEYQDPIAFFERTYLTRSLKQLLTGAIQHIRGEGGSPVVQLQTSFGGGKTHSMLVLFHLFSGVDLKRIAPWKAC